MDGDYVPSDGSPTDSDENVMLSDLAQTARSASRTPSVSPTPLTQEERRYQIFGSTSEDDSQCSPVPRQPSPPEPTPPQAPAPPAARSPPEFGSAALRQGDPMWLSEEAIRSMTVQQLKAECRLRVLLVSGAKRHLVHRPLRLCGHECAVELGAAARRISS